MHLLWHYSHFTPQVHLFGILNQKKSDGPSGFTDTHTCFLATHDDPIPRRSITESIKLGEHVPNPLPQFLSVTNTALVNISTT